MSGDRDPEWFLYRAFLQTRQTCEELLVGHTKRSDANIRAFYLEKAVESLRRASDELGFDLVKREPVTAPAHDGPDDGEYLSSIGGGRV